MINIRLMGMPEDVATLTACLGEVVEVLESASDSPYRGHSTLVRRYLTCQGTDRTLEIVATLVQRYTGNEKPPA